ncbi:MAG: polyphosphate polymerase domain-containing protein [Clostridia bacterium]|nr:polyphosphate polymerase domain-containing protein [Clostridia bacterium]
MEATTIFERKEIKYHLTKQQHDELLRLIAEHIAPDMHGLTTICNIYFDTPDSRLVRESIEKPLYKEKLRLRCYGVPNAESPAFLELKKKFRGIVYKRREILPYDEAMDFLVGGKRPERRSQIFEEIDWVLHFYRGLAPAMALFYDRIAFVGVEDPEFRVTFDNNILYRTEDLDLSHGAYGTPLLDKDTYIMELKISEAMPLWLTEALDKLKIFPASFSKYGTAYGQLLQRAELIKQ